MHLESLMEEIGGFGPFQIRMITLLSFFKSCTVLTMLMMAFAGVEPDWWCVSRDDNNATIYGNWSNKNCEWNSTCERVYDDYMITIVSEWDLVCDEKWIVNTIISIQMAGVLIGAIISGYGSDTYGRKKMLYSGILLATIGNLAAAFSVSWLMYTIVRFILGLAVGLSLSVLYLYQVEFVGKKWRGFVASLPNWSFGVVVLSVLVWAIKNWKWAHVAVACIHVPFLFTWWFVPESLRWLTVKGHLDEARRVVIRMAAINKKPIPDMSILELIANEERAEGQTANNYTYLDLFKTKKLARKTLFTCLIWFCLAVVYYSISFGVRSLSGDFYMNLIIMAVIEVPASLLILAVVYIFQRRTAAAIFFLLASASCFGFAIATKLAPLDIKGSLENGLAITAKFFGLSAWAVSQAMTSEQFPTVIRNLAFAAQNTSARVGSVLAAQLLSMGGKNDLMPPFIAMGILTSITALICFTLEETSKKALEDTMEKYATKVNQELLMNLMQNKKSDKSQNGLALSKDTEISVNIEASVPGEVYVTNNTKIDCSTSAVTATVELVKERVTIK